jgi:hypothetical protein
MANDTSRGSDDLVRLGHPRARPDQFTRQCEQPPAVAGLQPPSSGLPEFS